MKTRRKYKIIGGVMAALLLVVACLMGASFYMLDYSLGYTQQDRKKAEAQRNRIRKECPWTVAWMDSIYQNHAVKDTFVLQSNRPQSIFSENKNGNFETVRLLALRRHQ